jgi:hypothetical protein
MLLDPATNVIVCAIKLVRILTLWISIYFTEKIFQDKFVQQVYYGKSTSTDEKIRPPDIRYFMGVVLLIDAVAYGLFLCMLFSVSRYVIASSICGQVFTIDNSIFLGVLGDYIASSTILIILGVLLSNTIQNEKHLRYNDLGVRGIRAFSELILFLSIIVTLIPYYQLFSNV